MGAFQVENQHRAMALKADGMSSGKIAVLLGVAASSMRLVTRLPRSS